MDQQTRAPTTETVVHREPLKVSKLPNYKKITKPKTKSPKIKVKKVTKPKVKSKPFKTTRHTLGKVHLLVEKESWQRDVEIPQYAVESGKKISDHVEQKPKVLTLTGIIFADKKHKISEKINGLARYENDGKRLTYVGRRTGTNFLINRFSYDSESVIGNGHRFSITLQEVRIVDKQSKTKKKSAKNKTNAGSQQTKGGNGNNSDSHTVRSGDTYIALAKKYGTTWQKLYELNKYPARKIPIGVELKLP